MRRRPSRNRGGRFCQRGVSRETLAGRRRAASAPGGGGGEGCERCLGSIGAIPARGRDGGSCSLGGEEKMVPGAGFPHLPSVGASPSLASSAGRSAENALPARFRLVDPIPARDVAIGGRCFAVCRAIEKMVPGAGVEPAHLSVAVFETAASAIPPSGRRTAVYRKPDAPSSVLRSDGRAASNSLAVFALPPCFSAVPRSLLAFRLRGALACG